jgi:hypothetical protein
MILNEITIMIAQGSRTDCTVAGWIDGGTWTLFLVKRYIALQLVLEFLKSVVLLLLLSSIVGICLNFLEIHALRWNSCFKKKFKVRITCAQIYQCSLARYWNFSPKFFM